MVSAGVGTIVVGCATLVGLGAWYIGAFKKIQFKKKKFGPKMFLCRTGKGSYSCVGPHFGAVEKFGKANGVLHMKNWMGIYYDDPKKVKDPRWAVGFLVESPEDLASVTSLSKKELKANGLRIMKFKEASTMASEFPLRASWISMLLSIKKTYPAFERQTDFKLKSGALEVYDYEAGVITTHFPQSQIGQFQAPVEL